MKHQNKGKRPLSYAPSCVSHPSGSCCENYAIQYDLPGQTLREASPLIASIGAIGQRPHFPSK
jgi:hypothetical protein